MKGEVASELRSLLLFLCMESLVSRSEDGLFDACFAPEQVEDVRNLYWHLREHVVKDAILGSVTGHRLAMEREAEDKNKKE